MYLNITLTFRYKLERHGRSLMEKAFIFFFFCTQDEQGLQRKCLSSLRHVFLKCCLKPEREIRRYRFRVCRTINGCEVGQNIHTCLWEVAWSTQKHSPVFMWFIIQTLRRCECVRKVSCWRETWLHKHRKRVVCSCIGMCCCCSSSCCYGAKAEVMAVEDECFISDGAEGTECKWWREPSERAAAVADRCLYIWRLCCCSRLDWAHS